MRKWFYAYVMGVKEPQTWQQQAGTNDHACVEKYLETGVRVFSPRVAKGVHMLPPPGPYLQIEHDMVPSRYTACTKKHPHTWECQPCAPDHKHGDKCRQVSGLHLAPLRAAGIPVVGRIDLMHDLCVNYGAEGPEDVQDPEGTVEVFDHKFTKDLRYALKGTDMVRNIQMVAYGEYVFRTTEAKQVRLSHGYYPTNGNAVKRTIRVTREPISRYWSEHVEPLARSIADAAKETNPDKVKANTKACEAFGRVCVNAEKCSARMDAGLTLQAQVGGTAAQALLQILKKPKDTDNNMPVIPGKGLLAHIQKPNGVADTAAREAELAKLKAEEETAKKKLMPDWFPATWEAVLAFDKGQPQLGGQAAQIYAIYKGYTDWTAGTGYGGAGDLGDVHLTDVNQFQDLLKELKEAFGDVAPGTPPAGLLPDDAPVIDTTAATPPAPASNPPTPTANPLATVQAEAEKPKATTTRKTRTVKAKEDPKPEPEAPVVQPEPVIVVRDASEAPATDTKVNLLVDVSVEGAKYIDFASMVDNLAAQVAQRFNLDDLRMGGADSPLGFGKWKGVLSAAIREIGIPAGTYHIDARGNEVYEEAIQALRQVVKRTGGVYVRGTR